MDAIGEPEFISTDNSGQFLSLWTLVWDQELIFRGGLCSFPVRLSSSSLWVSSIWIRSKGQTKQLSQNGHRSRTNVEQWWDTAAQ